MKNIKIWVGEIEPARHASRGDAGGGYKLLDCGDKKKLEGIGGKRIVRSEPRAWWKRELPEEEWKKVDASLETVIDVGIEKIKAKIKFKNTSKHIGIFPEQMPQWQWISERIMSYELQSMNGKTERLNIFNLFGYTGIATLVCAKAGAKVTHVDASKQSVDWARENQKLSGLEDAPIRWIVDDVIKFVKKEKSGGEK